jgi:putative hydrolase of HD superfamily
MVSANRYELLDEAAPNEEMSVLINFLMHADRLKNVRRRIPTANSKRRERTAEHCWHIALAVVVLHRFAAEEVNLDRAVTLAVLHDLPEVEAGDTFIFSPRELTRRKRECVAMENLLCGLPLTESGRLRDLWEDFEYDETPEGRFVTAVDLLLPIFINLRSREYSSWVRHQVSATAVRKNIDTVRSFIPAMAAAADAAVDEGIRHGYLKEEILQCSPQQRQK